MLHTVNKSPFERGTLESCLQFVRENSSVLLIEDGVIAALDNTEIAAKIKSAARDVKFYVLGPDLEARGFGESNIIAEVEVVDYDGFVDLIAEHDNLQAWL